MLHSKNGYSIWKWITMECVHDATSNYLNNFTKKAQIYIDEPVGIQLMPDDN